MYLSSENQSGGVVPYATNGKVLCKEYRGWYKCDGELTAVEREDRYVIFYVAGNGFPRKRKESSFPSIMYTSNTHTYTPFLAKSWRKDMYVSSFRSTFWYVGHPNITIPYHRWVSANTNKLDVPVVVVYDQVPTMYNPAVIQIVPSID